jgi:hypothetical protein
MLSMREESTWKFKAMLTKRTETLVSTLEEMESINNGTSFTLMNGRENQEKESSTKSLDYMLRDHSM